MNFMFRFGSHHQDISYVDADIPKSKQLQDLKHFCFQAFWITDVQPIVAFATCGFPLTFLASIWWRHELHLFYVPPSWVLCNCWLYRIPDQLCKPHQGEQSVLSKVRRKVGMCKDLSPKMDFWHEKGLWAAEQGIQPLNCVNERTESKKTGSPQNHMGINRKSPGWRAFTQISLTFTLTPHCSPQAPFVHKFLIIPYPGWGYTHEVPHPCQAPLWVWKVEVTIVPEGVKWVKQSLKTFVCLELNQGRGQFCCVFCSIKMAC
jgi:hypothetical protein